MAYTAPTREQRFVLEHIAGIPELATSPRFANAEPDTIDAIIDGIGTFAQEQFAPLCRRGDRVVICPHRVDRFVC